MPNSTSDSKSADGLCWLHLSDIHFLPNHEWKDNTARDALLDFLQTQLTKNDYKVDFIFCTGDIAFGELAGHQTLANQYEMAKDFFDKVLEICQCGKEQLFVVPGNHDIDRNCVTEAMIESWAKWGEPQVAFGMKDEINEWFANLAPDAKEALKRLDAWGEFVAGYLPKQHEISNKRHHYAKRYPVRGRQIGIAGFNSAWTCAGDKDDRKIWLAAETQFNHMRDELKGTDLKIGLIHHPLDWFNLAERDAIKKRILVDAHFWLHGHTHKPWLDPLPTHITVGTGALTAGTEGEFGFNLVELDFSNGKGQTHFYRYDIGYAKWIEDTAVDPDGEAVWQFKLPKALRKPSGKRDAEQDNDDAKEQPSALKLLAWCDRSEICPKLSGHLLTLPQPVVGLFCLACDVNNHQPTLSKRIIEELNGGNAGVKSELVEVRTNKDFQLLAAQFDQTQPHALMQKFNKCMAEIEIPFTAAGKSQDATRMSTEVKLLYLNINCSNWPTKRIENLIVLANVWLHYPARAYGSTPLVLLLVLNFKDTFLTRLADQLRLWNPAPKKVVQAFNAARANGDMRALIGNDLEVLEDYDLTEVQKWINSDRVRNGIGDAAVAKIIGETENCEKIVKNGKISYPKLSKFFSPFVVRRG
jgi:predicted phosphodiesterase